VLDHAKAVDWIQVGCQDGVELDSSGTYTHDKTKPSKQQMEYGVLNSPHRITVYIQFERFPIWLLALDEYIISHVWIMGFDSQSDFCANLTAKGANLELVAAALDNVSQWQVGFTTNQETQKEAIFLVSAGLLDFVRRWHARSPNRKLVLCDKHIQGQKIWGMEDIRWLRL
jgi:hypothetical protein